MFDGATMPDSLPDAGHLPALTAALLDSGYTSSDVEKIAHGNWLRVIRDTWQA